MLLILSIWWSFSDKDYLKYESNSLKQPIFAVFTSPSCPHCKGIPERLQEYAEELGNESRVVFTAINCAKTKLCSKIGVQGVPHFFLIRGKDQRYWGITRESKAQGWTNYLESQVGPVVHKMDTISEEDFNQIRFGGTHFHLVINETNSPILKKFSYLSAVYRIYGCGFSYSIDKDSNTELNVYFSRSCYHKWNVTIDMMESIISSNLRSHYHHYDAFEFFTDAKSKPIFVIVTSNSDNSAYYPLVSNVLSNNSCRGFHFGWASMDRDEWVMEASSHGISNKPFIFGYNKKNKCTYISKVGLQPISIDGIIENMTTSNSCRKIGKVKTGLPPLPMWIAFSFAIGTVLGLSIVYLFILIIFRTKTNKQE